MIKIKRRHTLFEKGWGSGWESRWKTTSWEFII